MPGSVRSTLLGVVLGLTLCAVEGHAQSEANRWFIERPGLVLSGPVEGVIRVQSRGDGWARLGLPAFLNVVVHLQFRALTDDAQVAVLLRSFTTEL